MTPSQRERRFRIIKETGCIVCRGFGWQVAPDIHHQNMGQLAGHPRLGDDFTVGLCRWHHVSEPVLGLTAKECRLLLGPSMKAEPVLFRETFGSDEHLLARQNQLIERRQSLKVGA